MKIATTNTGVEFGAFYGCDVRRMALCIAMCSQALALAGRVAEYKWLLLKIGLSVDARLRVRLYTSAVSYVTGNTRADCKSKSNATRP